MKPDIFIKNIYDPPNSLKSGAYNSKYWFEMSPDEDQRDRALKSLNKDTNPFIATNKSTFFFKVRVFGKNDTKLIEDNIKANTLRFSDSGEISLYDKATQKFHNYPNPLLHPLNGGSNSINIDVINTVDAFSKRGNGIYIFRDIIRSSEYM